MRLVYTAICLSLFIAITEVNSHRAYLGSIQNRLSSTINTPSENWQNPCALLDFSDQQKRQINRIATYSKEKLDILKRDYINSRRQYGNLIMAGIGTLQQARRLDNKADEIRKAMSGVVHNYTTLILFKIVDEEQQLQTAKCIQYSQQRQQRERLLRLCEQINP
jgi:hypothetical protein